MRLPGPKNCYGNHRMAPPGSCTGAQPRADRRRVPATRGGRPCGRPAPYRRTWRSRGRRRWLRPAWPLPAAQQRAIAHRSASGGGRVVVADGADRFECRGQAQEGRFIVPAGDELYTYGGGCRWWFRPAVPVPTIGILPWPPSGRRPPCRARGRVPRWRCRRPARGVTSRQRSRPAPRRRSRRVFVAAQRRCAVPR